MHRTRVEKLAVLKEKERKKDNNRRDFSDKSIE